MSGRGPGKVQTASENALTAVLADISPDELSPRQALEVLYRLKELSENA